ncbi:unnamed protein product [Tilletia controversa]|uniref:Transglycosylase SLT domain-containing protein n=3 Tax=Tilletia TaxID=13289 RepID=A0A8X7MUN2_9BASI|nr:hypothetical protein CF336_g2694 [Tilletia laevis]KAE8202000.1 hypothetical protein CF328_g2469 [Tilletia controversa]KAE8257326.1 hypothetical protein A4X03_0g4705 [Tilletia caries]KAE8206592.1 hypothetical protein CF335_g1767 [Tilletia laevis]KAE8249688.1 hypothetical protein A4X06_0g3112 [Tilletia controversa]
MLSNLRTNAGTRHASFAQLGICLLTALSLCHSARAIPIAGGAPNSTLSLPTFGLNLGASIMPTNLGFGASAQIIGIATTAQQYRPHTIHTATTTVQHKSQPSAANDTKTAQHTAYHESHQSATNDTKTAQQTTQSQSQLSAANNTKTSQQTAHHESQPSAAAEVETGQQKGQSFAAASSSISNKYAEFRLTSNQASYGPSEVRSDLRRIMAWAGDTGNLNQAQEDETVAAILSVAARYYPELPTRAISRVLMADIKAESDFQPRLVSPGRLDSGDSWGLMQVSPGGGSLELKLFKEHARTSGNSFSWVYQPSKGLTMLAQPGMPNAGPLLDWKTGQPMDLASLTNQDLYRPWVNIHIASWIQANSARTSSQDPSDWDAIARAAQRTTISAQQLRAAQQGGGSGSDSSDDDDDNGGGSLLSLNIAGIKLNIPNLRSVHLSDLAKQATLLAGASLPRSVRTGLGTWVAGPATTGEGSFAQNGDDISKQYLRAISEGVGIIYKQDVKTAWLDGLKLNAGLVDYKP